MTTTKAPATVTAPVQATTPGTASPECLSPITVRSSRWHRALIATLGPTVGALLGFLAGTLIAVADGWGWLDAGILLGFHADSGPTWGVLITTAAGGIGGALFAATMIAEALRMKVCPDELELWWDDANVRVKAHAIRHISVARDIVIYGDDDVELARVRNDLDRGALLAALRRAGYGSIHRHDLHEHDFTTVSENSLITEDVRKLLEARAHAVKNGSQGDAELLRRRLVSKGVMVRDMHRPGLRPLHQQFRQLTPLVA